MCPMYTYTCDNDKCQFKMEVMQRMSDPPLVECLKCHQPTLIRDLHIPYIHIVQEDGKTTLGTLAERNAKKLSKEEKDKLTNTRKKRKSRVIPWWENGLTKTTRKKISQLKTKKQINNYVQSGEL